MNNIYDCKILIVDDEEALLEMLDSILRKEGFWKLFTASSCSEALRKFDIEKPDVALLDVSLSDGDGFSLMQAFRGKRNIPTLFLSARDEDEDRLLGLGLGADDYITKPFLPRELTLRLKAVIQRSYFPVIAIQQIKPVFRLGDINVDLNSGTVKALEKEFALTAKEYALIEKLYENSGNIVTGDALCRAAWGEDLYGFENTLTVHIRRLREKIESNPSSPKFLLTVRGLGYKLTGAEKA